VCCYTIEVCNVKLATWYYEIYQYLTKQEYPPGSSPKAQRALRLLASQYFEDKGMLYKKTNMGINLLCVTHDEVREIMKEVHRGEWRGHMNGRMLAKKV